jgi:hypothetical protein
MFSQRLIDLQRESFSPVFRQRRTCQRAQDLSLGTLCSFGRRTISRSICAVGRQHQDWSADYKLFSRSPWNADDLFDPVIRDNLERYPTGPVVIAFDDTKLPRTGRHVRTAFWQRDPLSPPFHANLLFGLRFLQASVIYPHYREGDFSARGIPVRFVECPAVKKPGRRADEKEWKAYREAAKRKNLSVQGLAVVRGLRNRLDALGSPHRTLLATLDGSFCNRTFFKAEWDRVDLAARTRKDARLCFRAPVGSRAFYSPDRFTPEQVRQDDQMPWRTTEVFFGGRKRRVRYKEVKNVLWQRGAGRRPLRLLVLAPQPYKTSRNAATNYRDPAYLLTTSLTDSVQVLIQAYLDRWQIEVNHRDEKDTLGVGQAQVWSESSVPRQPAFAVASYSLMLVAALREFGPGRTKDFVPLPKWRKNAKRPSALDLVTLLRQEMGETCSSGHRVKASDSETCDPGDVRTKIAENIADYAYT